MGRRGAGQGLDRPQSPRVVVVGAGNAALCAAIAAREHGSDVVVLERAPQALRGGNSAFTAGAMRVAYEGIDDIRELVDDLTEAESDERKTDFGRYTQEMFLDDIGRVTDYRADPDLADILVSNGFETLRWLRSHGVRFAPIFGRQAFEVDGRFSFWGGLTLEVVGGGIGLVDRLASRAEDLGVEILYGHRAVRLLYDGVTLTGVLTRAADGDREIRGDSVVLASGGFEANVEWRARYLGLGWDLAKVRGTRFNTGDGLRMALEAGAAAAGNWTGCHACAWDYNAPEFGNLAVGDGYQKHSYPFGIMVNRHGKRFVDEGYDFRNYTYARYGREILAQPGQCAWQIFDSKVAHLLRDEYKIREVTKARAESLEELARKLDGVNVEQFLATVAEYNAAVQQDIPFDPNRRDGRCTAGIAPAKSNWANTLDTPPFEAYNVTCGITFTFGGLRIDKEAQVLDEAGRKMPGLFACGELVGGLFYFNYPGGSGLTAGSVFGRIAGRSASETLGRVGDRSYIAYSS